jgi:hypothetical protein
MATADATPRQSRSRENANAGNKGTGTAPARPRRRASRAAGEETDLRAPPPEKTSSADPASANGKAAAASAETAAQLSAATGERSTPNGSARGARSSAGRETEVAGRSERPDRLLGDSLIKNLVYLVGKRREGEILARARGYVEDLSRRRESGEYQLSEGWLASKAEELGHPFAQIHREGKTLTLEAERAMLDAAWKRDPTQREAQLRQAAEAEADLRQKGIHLDDGLSRQVGVDRRGNPIRIFDRCSQVVALRLEYARRQRELHRPAALEAIRRNMARDPKDRDPRLIDPLERLEKRVGKEEAERIGKEADDLATKLKLLDLDDPWLKAERDRVRKALEGFRKGKKTVSQSSKDLVPALAYESEAVVRRAIAQIEAQRSRESGSRESRLPREQPAQNARRGLPEAVRVPDEMAMEF